MALARHVPRLARTLPESRAERAAEMRWVGEPGRMGDLADGALVLGRVREQRAGGTWRRRCPKPRRGCFTRRSTPA